MPDTATLMEFPGQARVLPAALAVGVSPAVSRLRSSPIQPAFTEQTLPVRDVIRARV